ncbi:MAG: PstS family phosphate ABC transporter substrate-binding protein [Gemmatimonadales bacterium]|jgi:phosphate transport system substrate-binding protein
MPLNFRPIPAAPLLCLAAATLSCSDDSERFRGHGGLEGAVRVDGSSTVYLISEAMAEEFQADHPRVRVTVGISGSGGGFKRFCDGETDISDASRPITEPELAGCRANGVEPIEIMVGFDGISVVVNPQNEFVGCLTVDELRRLWEPGSSVSTWSDLRATWPAEEIILYGPGPDSGTFDCFTEAVVGELKASRPDFTASEDDNVLVAGVAGDRYALGYFGYAYFVENTERLKLVAIDDGDGCVFPTPETIQNREYSPLARPLFIYIDSESVKRPEVKAFAEFYLRFAPDYLPQVGYVPLPLDRYLTAIDELAWRSGQ